MSNKRSIDVLLWLPAIGLWLIGLVGLWSLSRGLNYPHSLVWRQGVAGLLGLVLALACSRLKLARLTAVLPWATACCAGALLLVLVFGLEVNGARRWLELGPLGSFQPSEPAKVATLLSVALLISLRWGQSTLRMYLPNLALLVFFAALIFAQPDLGTAIILTTTGLSVLFLSGAPWWPLLALSALAVLALPRFLDPYQMQRLKTFLTPDADPTGAGWNLEQSKIAIGSGGLSGKGAFLGLQGPLDFLPEAHSDFLFSVLAEEYGFLGCSLILALSAVLVGRLFWHGYQATHPFRRLALLGLAVHFGLHTVLNTAMTVGLAPVTGSPLLFVSFGGSALVSSFLAVGIAQSLVWAKRF